MARMLSLKIGFHSQSRGIVFCTSIADCKSIAEAIGVSATFYYSDNEDNQKNLANWKAGKAPVIVSTSALIAGLDYGYVDYILFAKTPYGMIDFVQGAGRGGRMGRACYVVLIDDGFYSKIGNNDTDYKCVSELISWCKDTGKRCLRSGIGKVMNGIAQSCSEISGAEMCALCYPEDKITLAIQACSSPPPPAFTFPQIKHLKRSASMDMTQQAPFAKRKLVHHLRTQSTDIGLNSRMQSTILEQKKIDKEDWILELESKLLLLKGKCVSCYLFLQLIEDAPEGEAACDDCMKNICTFTTEETTFSFCKWKAQMIKYSRSFSYCYTCDVPQRPYLIESHGPLNAMKMDHPYKDIIAVAWMIAFRKASIKELLVQRLGQYGFTRDMTFKQYSEWLTADDAGFRFSNGLYVFGIALDMKPLY